MNLFSYETNRHRRQTELHVESVSKPIVEDQRFQTLRSDFVFFAVFVFFVLLNEVAYFLIVSLFTLANIFSNSELCSELESQSCSSSASNVVQMSSIFFVFSCNMFFAHVSLSNQFPTIQLTSNALVQHANYFLEGLAPLERVQVAYSLFGKPAYDEIHSVQLSFR